ncbi:MAG TPA: diacylglycerol kinase family protein [Ktedonobacterales bacterium]|nr:diacylglycerol kinase family protein [Ktedonobacterales bacterium]
MAETPLVILNPKSNSGRAERLRGPLERALAGGRGALTLTKAPRDAERLARDAAESGRDVVVVGGDGTITEAANGVLAAGATVRLGVVPAGSGNDYAYETLKLPHEPLRALEIALTGDARPMDVGQVNGRYFLNALGVGLDANIAAAAEKLKRYPFMRGQTLYWAASLRELLFHYNLCPQLTVRYDDQPGERRVYALAAVSIGPTYGGGFRINPDADPHDGYFDLCTIWKPSLPRALRLLPMVEKGKHLREKEVARARVRHIVMEADRLIHAHLDGEVMLEKRFEARILPGALLVRQ